MLNKIRILIADDDADYARITMRFLTNEGYSCEWVPDGFAAEDKLRLENFDLLIADIEMEGNSDLQFIMKVPELAPGLPVIVATAYPSVGTAINSLNMPVTAYLLKPLDYSQLAHQIQKAVSHHQVFKAVSASEARLNDWQNNLTILKGMVQSSNSVSNDIGLRTFLSLTFNNMVSTMGELKTLLDVASLGENATGPCRILECPLKRGFEDAIENAIEALKATKGAFKSKEIADLRVRLEQLLKEERRQFNRQNN